MKCPSQILLCGKVNSLLYILLFFNRNKTLNFLKLKTTIKKYFKWIQKKILSGTSRTYLWAELSPWTSSLWCWVQTHCVIVFPLSCVLPCHYITKNGLASKSFCIILTFLGDCAHKHSYQIALHFSSFDSQLFLFLFSIRCCLKFDLSVSGSVISHCPYFCFFFVWRLNNDCQTVSSLSLSWAFFENFLTSGHITVSFTMIFILMLKNIM